MYFLQQHEFLFIHPLELFKSFIVCTYGTVFSRMCEKCSLLFSLIGKFVSLQSSEDSDSSRSDVSMRVIIVLDPAVHIQIKPSSTIRIYPPW
jgi:hypothetical protein